jgi:outer membrane lipoprotein-sorting protein
MSDNRQSQDDRLEEAVKAFRQMTVPDRPPDAGVLAQFATAPGEATPAVPVPSSPKRRFLMRLVVPSAAALVLLGTGALVLLTATPTLTLADVVKAAEKHKLVKYKNTQTTETKDGESGSTERTTYFDLKSPRSRTEARIITLNGAVESVSIQISDGQKNRFLHTLSETVVPGQENNRYLKGFDEGRFPRKEAFLSGGNQDNDPKKKKQSLLDSLRELEQHKSATVTKEKLGGRETVKYYLEDGKKTTQLWVDPKTELPVRFEFEILDHTPDIPRNRWVYTDFEWDPKLPKGFKDLDALFDTTPPEGYKLNDQTKNEKK